MFLSELLYMADEEGLAFDQFKFSVGPERLEVGLSGVPFLSMRNEIKAVTYPILAIMTTDRGLEVTVVLDV